MGLNFRKSINLGKGFKVNLSKSGVGFSWGVKGARITRTASGKTKATVSAPGTGLSYTQDLSGSSKKSGKKKESSNPLSKLLKSIFKG